MTCKFATITENDLRWSKLYNMTTSVATWIWGLSDRWDDPCWSLFTMATCWVYWDINEVSQPFPHPSSLAAGAPGDPRDSPAVHGTMALRGHVPWTKKRCHTARITAVSRVSRIHKNCVLLVSNCTHHTSSMLSLTTWGTRAISGGLAHLGLSGLAALGHHTPVRMLSSAQEDSTV